MSISVDDGAYPFVLQQFPRGRKPERELYALFARMSEIAKRAAHARTVHVVVAVGDEDFNAAERKIIAACMEAAPPEEVAHVIGAFAVIESPLARGVLTALRWLAPMTLPVVPARTPDEAIDLAAARLRGAEVTVPPAIEEDARVRARRPHAEAKRG
jgi:hypothetical protein